MATIKALNNQSMQDIVLTAYGTLEAAVAFCVANGVAISDTPVAGTEYLVPDGPVDRKVLATYAANGTVPATLALPPCGIITGIAVGEVTATSAVVRFTLPDEGIGWEWRVSNTSEQPTTGAAGEEDGELVLADLEPETNYYVWLRTVCEDNYSSWRSVRVRTAEAEPLGLTVVLNPLMTGQVGSGGSNIVYYASPKLGPAPEYTDLFVHTNDLIADWLATNRVKWQGLTNHGIDPGGAGTLVVNSSLSGMPARTALYSTPLYGADSLFWSELTDEVLTMTFKDVEGNQAISCPVVLVRSTGTLRAFLIAEISVEVVEATTESVTVRIRRQHASDVAISTTMTWARDANDGTPDPDDVHNEDLTIKTFTAGTYELSVRTTYQFAGVDLPMSVVTCIITIG